MNEEQNEVPEVQEDPDRPVRSASDVDMLRRVQRCLEELA